MLDEIKKCFGNIFQKARISKNITQEQIAENLSKSSKTISQIETGKDGTSKQTDIALMNLLEITPNELYKNFITNSSLKRKIELAEEICDLSPSQITALFKIVEAIKEIEWNKDTFSFISLSFFNNIFYYTCTR